MKIVIATRNAGKVKEFARLLADVLSVEWLSLDDAGIAQDLPEDGDTFVANARQKAELASRLFGGWALADDSGLCVEALEGRPGVFTARYGGKSSSYPEKWALMLEEMAAVPWEQRGAWFECVLALAHPQAETQVASGRCVGRIGFAPQGTGGFGFDPLFYVDAQGCTLAEVSPEVKDSLSHRGSAARAIRPVLARLLAGGDGMA